MAEDSKAPNEEELEAELRSLEMEIVGLRTAKRDVLEKARPFNEQLAAIARRERECVDKLDRLRAEKHDRETQRKSFRRLVEMESEIRQLRHENATLKRDSVACREMSGKLRRSLEQTTKHSKLQMRKIADLNEQLAAERRSLRSADVDRPVLENTETLRKRLTRATKVLSRTQEELNETRQRLSDVQERLTVAEQVTAATQQRQLQEFDNAEQLELTPQHQPATSRGTVFFTDY